MRRKVGDGGAFGFGVNVSVEVPGAGAGAGGGGGGGGMKGCTASIADIIVQVIMSRSSS